MKSYFRYAFLGTILCAGLIFALRLVLEYEAAGKATLATKAEPAWTKQKAPADTTEVKKTNPPSLESKISQPFVPTVSVPKTASPEALRFLEAAKQQIGVVKTYDFGNGYYKDGGAPPPDTGVCTDVIWRAYRDIGHDLPKLVQKAVKKNPKAYEFDLDPNINYRRVKRLQTYFLQTSKSLAKELVPGDVKNLAEWQPWDIVIFEVLPANHLWHIGIVSDETRPDGVPYLVDNHGEGVSITITPLDWPTKVIGHFRVF